MYHVPIVNDNDLKAKIEFCHIKNPVADRNTWKIGEFICLDEIKINIFKRGEFSVVVENERYSPVSGDFSVFPPHKLHYGQIPRPTVLDYYQLDIGTSAFDALPNGRELLLDLVTLSKTKGCFVRPKGGVAWLLMLCENIETAILDGKLALAYAYVVELVSKIRDSYLKSVKAVMKVLSKYVVKSVEYIENHYSSRIKIEELSSMCGVSASYLSRLFKKEVGISIHTYLNNYRIMQSIDYLKENSVACAAYAVGFGDSSHFISTFKRMLGCTPTEYLKSHQ